MSTRRLYLQPGESAEILNGYGTSLLKVEAMFDEQKPVAILYPQPGVQTYGPSESAQFTSEPQEKS